MYRAELNYTLKDIRRFEKVHQMLRSKVLTIVMRVVLIAGCLALAAATFMQFYYGVWTADMVKYYMLLVVSTVLWFVLKEVRLRGSLKALRGQGTIIIAADEEGVRADAAALHTNFTYDAFCDIVYSRDTYYLYISKIQAQIIPERCITEGDPAAFGSFMEQKTGLKIKEIK